MTVQPGWYADPAEPTTQRYWDGEGWVGAPLPVDATPPPGPPPTEPEPEPAPPPSGGAGALPGSPAAPGASGTSAPQWGGTPQTWGGAPPAGPAPGGPPVSGAPAGTPPPGAPPASGGPGQPGVGAPPSGWPAYGAPPHGAPPHGTPTYGMPPYGPAPHGWPPYGPPPPGWPNPYPPPPRPHGLELAPLGARVVARLIDIGLVFLLNVVVNGWFVWRFVEEFRPVYREITRRVLAGESSTEGLPQASAQADGLQVVILLIAVALWFAYEVPSVANTGQTFGKRVMGIKVVPLAETEQLGFGRSFRRWNMLGLPVFLWSCCGVGFLIQLVDCALPFFDRPLRQALHDKRGQTVVVRLPRQPGSPTDPSGTTGGSPTDSSGSPTDRPGGSAS